MCTWRITVPSAKTLHIGFSHFELQAQNILGKCVDYVEVFNGATMASLGLSTTQQLLLGLFCVPLTLILKPQQFSVCFSGQFCGFAPPSNMTVPTNVVVIRFLSNGANQQQGFRGYWTTDSSIVPTLPPPSTNPWDTLTIGESFRHIAARSWCSVVVFIAHLHSINKP